MSDLVFTKDIWPRIAKVFGLDESGKNVTRFELVVAQPIPVVRIEMMVSAGQALDLQSVLAEYALCRKASPPTTAQPEKEAA
jgi:hypothetical protein